MILYRQCILQSIQLIIKVVFMENELKAKTNFLFLLFHQIVYMCLNQIGALCPMKRQQKFNLNHLRVNKIKIRILMLSMLRKIISGYGSELNHVSVFVSYFPLVPLQL